MFKKIFPIEEERRDRFKWWIRCDIEGVNVFVHIFYIKDWWWDCRIKSWSGYFKKLIKEKYSDLKDNNNNIIKRIIIWTNFELYSECKIGDKW